MEFSILHVLKFLELVNNNQCFYRNAKSQCWMFTCIYQFPCLVYVFLIDILSCIFLDCRGLSLGSVICGVTVNNYLIFFSFPSVYAALLKHLKLLKRIGPHLQKGTFWTEILWWLSYFSLMQVFRPKELTWIVLTGLDAIMYDAFYIESL